MLPVGGELGDLVHDSSSWPFLQVPPASLSRKELSVAWLTHPLSAC
jgi:hypothetical protein